MLKIRLQLFHYLLRSSVFTSVMAASETANQKPKLIVFDLDYTLWPFWVDTHVDPPFKKDLNGKVYDVHGREVKFYPEVPKVLEELHSQGYKIGIASRTSCRSEASDLTHLFNWDQFFHYKQIYPGSKTTHFSKMHKDSGIAYEDMIFFDDEHRNVAEVGKMGVLCILVNDGVSKMLVAKALKEFAQRKMQSGSHSLSRTKDL